MKKLEIALVPRTAWYQNLRSLFTTQQWDFIRKTAYHRANYCCEICGGKGLKHPVEAHEEWHYDDENHVITLDRVTAICPDCHRVKHIGLAEVRNELDIALEHLSKINQQSMEESKAQAKRAFEVWCERSSHQWTMNLKNLREWINNKVPLPESVILAQKEVNELRVTIQKTVESLALQHHEKPIVNHNFNLLLNQFYYGRGLEETLSIQKEHYIALLSYLELDPTLDQFDLKVNEIDSAEYMEYIIDEIYTFLLSH